MGNPPTLLFGLVELFKNFRGWELIPPPVSHHRRSQIGAQNDPRRPPEGHTCRSTAELKFSCKIKAILDDFGAQKRVPNGSQNRSKIGLGGPEAAEAPLEASRGPLGTNFGSLSGLIWGPFWNSRRLIFEQSQRQRRQRQSQPLPPPPQSPLAPQGLQLWSLWFHHGGLGRQPHWNRSRNRLLVFRFRAF